jgi:hypothetical protein
MTDKSVGLSGASDRIRETAKWFAVSVAALGAVVAAGSQLTDIGKLDLNSGRLWIAVAGAGVAIAGALVILWVVVDTMTGEAVSLHGIATQTPAGAEAAVADPTLLAAFSNVAAVESEYMEAVEGRRTAYDDARAHPGDQDKINVANLADNRFVAIDQVVGPLLNVVSYQHLAHAWKNARIGIVVGAVAAAFGVGVFAWAAHPPPDAAASMAAANVLTAPEQGRVQLTAAGMSALPQSVGAACWSKPPEGTAGQPSPSGSAAAVTVQVLVLAKTDAGPDVLIDQTGCNQVRVLLGSSWGTLTE